MPDLSIPRDASLSRKSSPITTNPIGHDKSHNFTLSARRRRKLKAIKDAAQSGEAAVLRQLALADGGLVSDEMRKTIWPILLDLGYYKCLDFANDGDSLENFHDADDSQNATDDERSSFCT
uniref:Rab-GAP TBC domain-containing protein n=1 Tax=Romanomermis culicivorax TaxID=13658 RepID=A0A915J9B1_ROMCU